MPAGRDNDGRTTPPPRPRHVCRIVIQSRRQPALDLRGVHAADVTSLSVYVTVRLWWVGTPIPACRAALAGRQPRNLSSLRQPDKRFPRVPKLPLPFSTSLVKPASTRGPDFETELATLDEHWQERTIACSAKRVTSARRMTSTPAHLKGRKRNLSRRWEDCGKSQ
jgi:hypothetical protein